MAWTEKRGVTANQQREYRLYLQARLPHVYLACSDGSHLETMCSRCDDLFA